MATKKKPVKPARATAAKAAKATKPVKKVAVKSSVKTAVAAKKTAPKKVAAKTAAKKVATKKAISPATKQAAKKAAPKKTAVPTKAAPKKVVQVAAKKTSSTPVKKAPVAVKPEPKKPESKTHIAEKKQTVEAAVTSKPVKEAAKPQTVEKKEPAKPAKVVIPKTSTTKAVKYEPDFTKSVLDTNQTEASGPTMRYSDAELQEFRELITKKLDTAKKELAYLQGLITRKDEGGDMEDGRYMTMEDGSMSMEREQLSQMASRQIQFIDHLEKAMMRIENKTYGVCRVTGKLIDKARLRAVPHATLSIEAKQLMNK